MELSNPWERRPGESLKAYAAFCVYRDTGDKRSYAIVASTLGKSKTLIDRWGSAWSWVGRVQAWEDHLALEAIKEQERDYKNMLARQTKDSVDMQKKGMDSLNATPHESITTRDAAYLVELGFKHERISRGAASDIIRQEQTGTVTVKQVDQVEVSESMQQLRRALWEDRAHAPKSNQPTTGGDSLEGTAIEQHPAAGSDCGDGGQTLL